MNAKLVLSAVALTGGLITTTQIVFGQDWTLTSAPSANWVSIASSANGAFLVASAYQGQVYISTNSGTDWRATSLTGTNWGRVATSADGRVLLVPGYPDSHLSTNWGASWTLITSGSGNYHAACSADGSKLALGQVWFWFSTNSATTWFHHWTPVNDSHNVACAADGSIFVASSELSADSSADWGNSWTGWQPPTPFLAGIAVSASGQKLVAVTGSPQKNIFRSNDRGVTWITNGVPVAAGWNSVASSADGSRLIFGAGFYSPGPIYTSTNSGVTWTSNNAPNLRWTVASSADGGALVAAATQSGGIYTARPVLSPPSLAVLPQGTSLVISWIVPSRPFQLQQNSNLSSVGWADLQVPPTLTNVQHQVVVPDSQAARFFRLSSR